MNIAGLIAAALVAWLCGYFLTQWFRNYSIRVSWLDVPDARSSHDTATPTGGGVAVVAIVFAGITYLVIIDPSGIWPAIGLSIIGLAALGWIDDRRNLSVRVRLAVQILVALVAIYAIAPIREIDVGGAVMPFGVAGYLVAGIWIVWMTNLYNFMDGIDGLATVQGIVGAGTLCIWFVALGAYDFALCTAIVFGALLGFLKHNWYPASIFLGDVGSLALGGLFGIIGVVGVVTYKIPITAYIILFGVFIGDATLTLARRLYRGENLLRAHRTHFYQRAVQASWSHGQVSVAVLVANLVLAVLATCDAFRFSPRVAWPVAAIVVLAIMGSAVALRRCGPNARG